MSEDQFIAFVNEQTDRMKSYLTIGAGREINFYELEEALKGYTQVYLSLLNMVNLARIEAMRTKEDFDMWYAEKFTAARAKYNTKDLSAQKWAGQKELECIVRTENHEEFKRRKKLVLEADQKETYLSNITDMWKGYAYTLSTLSNNVRAEVGSAGIENRFSH